MVMCTKQAQTTDGLCILKFICSDLKPTYTCIFRCHNASMHFIPVFFCLYILISYFWYCVRLYWLDQQSDLLISSFFFLLLRIFICLTENVYAIYALFYSVNITRRRQTEASALPRASPVCDMPAAALCDGATWTLESTVTPGYARPDGGATALPRNVDSGGKLTPGGTSDE